MSDTEYTVINITLNSHERPHFIPFSKLLHKMNQMFLDLMKLSLKSLRCLNIYAHHSFSIDVLYNENRRSMINTKSLNLFSNLMGLIYLFRFCTNLSGITLQFFINTIQTSEFALIAIISNCSKSSFTYF